jgi:hypothetical protein
VGKLAPLGKGPPKPEELKRLAYGYQRLKYLQDNWEKETTVCSIPGCIDKPKAKLEQCGCVRDPSQVQRFSGFTSLLDPLYKAGDLMVRASQLIETQEDADKYDDLVDAWNKGQTDTQLMAYVSSWGEANPGGGQSEVARYLEKSRKSVVKSVDILKQVCIFLNVPLDATSAL